MLKIGTATATINHVLGRYIQAAGHENRATAIHGDLEANALYLSDGDTSILLVSCDLACLENDFVSHARETMAAASGLLPREIILTCTHTHGGPVLLPTNSRVAVDTDYIEKLSGWLVQLAAEAVSRAIPGRLGWKRGSAAIGFNRRCCWADGTHSMHGDTTREDFTGLEGPHDHDHTALFAQDLEGRPLAILHHNTTHPTNYYGARVYSADFPGAARTYLREYFGEAVPILFLNGAQGDIAMEDQQSVRKGKETREQKVARLGHLVAGEALRLLSETKFHEAPALVHQVEDLRLAVNAPKPERVEWAAKTLERCEAGEKISGMDRIIAHGIKLLTDRFQGGEDIAAIHAVRIGDLALLTQPFELYCQFGLDIKRRSPFRMTAVVGLADGYGGYMPTLYGALGGGYSGEPIYWTRFHPEAGYRVVDAAARLLGGIQKLN